MVKFREWCCLIGAPNEKYCSWRSDQPCPQSRAHRGFGAFVLLFDSMRAKEFFQEITSLMIPYKNKPPRHQIAMIGDTACEHQYLV
ncbi:hypothetical protein AGR7A_pAt20127 [Agrobacterium deltaense NCPPB 1641]|uniref:Uncharacterized protein n=1 Tax=Agrobacterium deltaense NCPPB 1641 TaxID=1183425 RepID=A0A1S7U8E5_9HYPH|nr:hypothetical protein AGR7A_pAt20127 [Agrobacterium deltaense NCPPB 1641]